MHPSQIFCGPGGLISWDDFAIWLRRVDIHVRALETDDLDAGQVTSIANALRGDVDAAMVVNGVKREDET